MSIDLFDIICQEICSKQNGIALKTGDTRELRDSFLSKGGDIEALTLGVLPQFDLLKGCILECFRAGKIGSQAPSMRSTISVDVASVLRQHQDGRRVSLALANESLGPDLVKALFAKEQT